MAIETWENFFKFIVFPDETTFYLAISPVPIIVNIDPMVSPIEYKKYVLSIKTNPACGQIKASLRYWFVGYQDIIPRKKCTYWKPLVLFNI